MSMVLVITIILAVGFSRVALGVHSFNQVLYGWSYGTWLAFFLFRYARPILQVHIRRLLAAHSDMRKFAGYYAYLAFVIFACISVFQLFNFLVARRDFQLPPPQLWLDNMQAKCGLTFNEHKMFVVPAFIKMGILAAPFGAYFGMLYDTTCVGPTSERINSKSSLWLVLLRFFVIAVVVLPLTIPFFFISSANHVWVLYIFKNSMPFFIAPFVMFAFGKQIFEKLGIQRDAIPTS